MISLIAVMLILGVLGVSVVAFTHTSEHSHLSANSGSRAYYLAESGLRYAQQVYCAEGWLHGRDQTLTLQGGDLVNIIRIADSFVATATANPGTGLEARARVAMPLSLCGADPDAPASEDFAIFGDTAIVLGPKTAIQGDVAIVGNDVDDIKGNVEGNILARDVTIKTSGITVEGNIYSSGTVSLQSPSTVTGDINAATFIDLKSGTVEGWLFSGGNITVKGATVLGRIYSCGGNVTLESSAVVGTAAQPVEIRATGNVSLAGATVYGNIYAGGTISLQGSANLHGNAYAVGDITGSTINGEVHRFFDPDSPQLLKPICPDLTNLQDLELPEATEFTNTSTNNVSVPADTSVSPDPDPVKWGALTLPQNPSGDTRLILRAGSDGPSNYYFTRIGASGGSLTTIYLDLSTPNVSASGAYNDIRIFVTGDVNVHPTSLNIYITIDNGDTWQSTAELFPLWLAKESATIPAAVAARVYLESQGNFKLASGSYWFGSVYTPTGSLTVGNQSHLIGSFFSGGGHSITNDTEIIHVAPNFFQPPEEGE